MFDIRSIIRENNATFYDYRSGKKHNSAFRHAIFVIASFILSLLFVNGGNDFLSGVITIQSILIGFSFSVMFFLLSSDGQSKIYDPSSIENDLRTKKINKLSQELFFNIAYFNLVSAACLVLALLILLKDAESILIFDDIFSSNYAVKFREALYFAAIIGFCIFKFLFFYFLIESSYSFARTVNRVSFLFKKKIEMNELIRESSK